MSWNDGLSKEFNTYFENVLGNIENVSIESVKEAVDKASKNFYKEIVNSTPVRTGG